MLAVIIFCAIYLVGLCVITGRLNEFLEKEKCTPLWNVILIVGLWLLAIWASSSVIWNREEIAGQLYEAQEKSYGGW